MRNPAPTDFPVAVDKVGDFVFARRTIGDGIKIRREFARLVEDVAAAERDPELAAWANIIATLTVLRVVAPPPFDGDLAAIPVDDSTDTMGKLILVYDALRAKEDSFRHGPEGASATSGA